jgi:serine/threonine protein kinase
MALAGGDRLGAYEIISPLGAGGMGEVYRAKDPRLGRDVAIKVLPAEFSAGTEAYLPLLEALESLLQRGSNLEMARVMKAVR